MKEIELADKFIAFLIKERDFPEVVLRREFGVVETKTGSTLHPDLVVLDPNRSGFTAVIEFVNNPASVTSSDKRRQLLQYRSALGKVHGAAYIVGPANSSNARFFIQQVFSANEAADVAESDFPEFYALLMGETAKRKAETDQEAEVIVDSFRTFCWFLAAVVVVFLILDITKVLSLTAQQLTLLALACGLALAPYAAKFKFLGIEWERQKEEDHKRRPSK